MGMRYPFAWLVALSIGCLAATVARGGEEVSFPDLGEAVPGHEGITYLDLARMVVPDLARDETGSYSGSDPVAMRHIQGPKSGGTPPQRSSFPFAGALPVKSGGKKRLLLLLDLNTVETQAEGYAALALYDLAGKPALLDVANVASDMQTYFRSPARIAAGTGDDAVATMSMHANSSQAYVTTQLILLHDDRLEPIDTIFTFDNQGCGWRQSQQLDLAATPGTPFGPIVATVTEERSLTGDDCGEEPPPAFNRTITVTYRWNGARYEPDSDAFDKLAADNEKRF
jgi:hypothetical protein